MKNLFTRYTFFLLLLAGLLPARPTAAQALRGTLAAGLRHSLSIHADGTLWAIGNNQQGQLGTGNTTGATDWIQVGTATNWVQIASLYDHSLGLRADGTLWAWGSNEYGQLGNPVYAGTTAPNPTPTQVPGTYKQIAAGIYHSLALRADGTLYGWGSNRFGQLGNTTNNGTTNPNITPVRIGTDVYVGLASGANHTLALRADGALFACGVNFSGQLGNGGNGGTNMPNPSLTQVIGTYAQVAAGYGYSLALRADGSLYAWGINDYGQLGLGTNSLGAVYTPTRVGTDTYSQMAGADTHTLAVRTDGSLYAWGYNYYGQLGTANSTGSAATPVTTPTRVGTGTNYLQVAAGTYHSLALRADGTVQGWGSNQAPQFGPYPYSDINPTPKTVTTGLATRSLAMGGSHGLAVRGDGTLWAWGSNTYGQLGQPASVTGTQRPVQVGTDRDWILVAAGTSHSLALKADGRLYAWGLNYYGQLGTATNSGTSVPVPTPTQVGTDRYVGVAAGTYHSLGLRADGTLYAWGTNFYGQLGNYTNSGNTNPTATPTRVGTELYRQVAAGDAHSMALRVDGVLFTWGQNLNGQLGNSTNLAVSAANPAPRSVAGTYAQLAAGGSHSLALQADGTAYAWGSNQNGQLGNSTYSGTTIATYVPTPLAGTYVQLAAGLSHSLGLRADGSLYTWGSSSQGQLGQGNTTATNATPTREVTLGASWTTLGTGSAAQFSLVRTASAQSFASAGLNGSGQLGDGTTTLATRFDRVSPLTSLQSLPVRPGAAPAGLVLYPNPAGSGVATLSGATPAAAVQVVDALGRLVATAVAAADGTARLTLPAGFYLVRCGTGTVRLVVE